MPENHWYFIESFDRITERLSLLLNTIEKQNHPAIVLRFVETCRISINMHAGKDIERWQIKKSVLNNTLVYCHDLMHVIDPIRFSDTLSSLQHVAELVSQLIDTIPFDTYKPEPGHLN